MRQFVVVSHEAPIDPDFSLDDLAGGAGRLDVLCRCVGAALLISHGVREDTRVSLVLRDDVTVWFDGASVRNLAPGERAIAGLVRAALGAADRTVGEQPVEASPGVSVARHGLEGALAAARRAAGDGGTLVQLHEDGRPVTELDPPISPTFVLSDHRDFTDTEESLLADLADERVRLGPVRLHAETAIAVANHYLDTDGFVAC